MSGFESLPRRPCPACAAVDPGPVFAQRFAQISGSLLSGYEVVVCRACGCGYADRLPAQQAFDAYYRDLSKYDHSERSGRESEQDRARFGDIADLIARFVPDKASPVVEIGCATGGLLACLRDRGLSRVEGVDPSPYSAKAVERLYGIPARAGTLSEDLALSAPAGMIVLVGVLEHIRDLDPALERVRNLLAPRGRIYVEVPDVTRFAEFIDAPYQQFSVEHVIFFSTASLERTLRRNGFVPVHQEQDARPDSASSTMPVVAAVYERSDDGQPASARDEATLPALREYVEKSAAMDRGIQNAIDRLVDSGEPVVVWGVGTHTARLLETSRLRKANIRAFVDSNANYHGKELAGVPILPPDVLRERTEPVLISSRVFQKEIAAQIRQQLRCQNPIILLYPG